MAEVHPTAIVDSGAELADGVVVGPYCIVSANARLGEGVRLHSHVVVGGTTVIGAGSQVFPFASVGMPPQDRKFRGETSRLEIGRNCTIREHVTINPGTEGGGLVTRIGDNCLLLVGSHVAHDCLIGDNVTLVNHATLAGHCRVGDYAILGGLSAVHQFVRIGESGFIGGMSGVENDVIPFGSAIGNRAALGGLNIIGLTRRGFPREAIHRLRRAYRTLFGPEGTLKERLADVAEEFAGDENVRKIVDFIRDGGDRAICTPRERNADP
ncbi:MAG TPA: acyl-ACP--UDP-N-acetylglucosamine O-acyltransferase [Propylenella sp.]